MEAQFPELAEHHKVTFFLVTNAEDIDIEVAYGESFEYRRTFGNILGQFEGSANYEEVVERYGDWKEHVLGMMGEYRWWSTPQLRSEMWARLDKRAGLESFDYDEDFPQVQEMREAQEQRKKDEIEKKKKQKQKRETSMTLPARLGQP